MKKALSLLIVLAMLIGMVPSVFAAEDGELTFSKVDAAELTAGTYLISGISANAMSDGTNTAFMTTEGSTASRLMGAGLTVESDSVTTSDTAAMWELIETEGGFYVKNVATQTYLYWSSEAGGGNKIYQTESQEEADVWSVVEVAKDSGNGYTLAQADGRGLSCNLFGSDPNKYLGFAAYTHATTSCACLLEFYKVAEASEEEPVVGNVLVDGDNAIEIAMGNPDPVEYNYVATQTGRLYIEVTTFSYLSEWSDEPYPMDDYLGDLYNFCDITVNGEHMFGSYFGYLDVAEGDVITVAFTNNYPDYYSYIGTLNLGYTDNLPVPGVDCPLTTALVDLYPNTPEIGAGESIEYTLSYEAFSGYVLRFHGDVTVSYTYFDYNLYEEVEAVLEDVDGVLEYDIDEYGCDVFTLTNNGAEAASIGLSYYAPEGSRYNPIHVENLEDIHITAEAEKYVDIYYTWTANAKGTILADYVDYVLYIVFRNETTGETSKYNNDTKQFSIHVNPGDKLTIEFSGSRYDGPIDYTFAYTFVEGDPIGSAGNPIVTDLVAGQSINISTETVHYSWTPEQSAIVTLGYTSASSYNTNVPTVIVNGEAYTLGEEITVTAGEPVIVAVSFEGSYGSVRGTLQATVVEVIEEEIELENPLVIGDNEFEIAMGNVEPIVYNFRATETGRLYMQFTTFEYCSQWSEGEYSDMSEYLHDLSTYLKVTVNGEKLVGDFFGFIDVVEGEVYSVTMENQADYFGYHCVLNLSYTDNLPIPGIDTPLTPALVDAFPNTVEIPAGGSVQYELSYYAFSGYIFCLHGDVSITYSYEDYSTWPSTFVEVTVEDVDGLLEFSVDEANANVLTIVNNGTEAASFQMSYYAPEGGRYNPIRVENLEDIHAVGEVGAYMDLFYVWTANKTGTIIVPYEYVVYVSFYNQTSETYGEMNYDDYTFTIHVYEGDELLINLSGNAYESAIDYWFNYTFVEGEPIGSAGNPIDADLFAGVYLDSMYNETVYYNWVPSESANVTIGFADQYGGSNVPVITLNGEAYNLGDEIAVTAGEAILVGVTAGEFYLYGTVQATVVQPEQPEPELPENGEVLVEETLEVPNSWLGTSKTYEMTADGTLYIVINGYPEDTTVEYACYVTGNSKTYYHTHKDGAIQFIDVQAGDTVKIELCLCVLENNTAGAYVGGEVSYSLIFVPAEGGDEPIEPGLEGSGTYEDPFIIDSIDDIHFVAPAGEDTDYYYQWTATEMGTLFVTVDERAILGLENQTTYLWGTNTADYAASIFVEAGDVVLINIYEYSDEEIDCVPTYEFVPGYPVGHANNPAIVDLFEGVDVSLDWGAEYYMIWTPAENATVVINFTANDRWSTEPVISVNGEEYTFGTEITVAAGESVTIALIGTAGWGSNGTVQATAVEPEVEALMGDVNGDSSIDSRDAMLVMQYFVGMNPELNVDVADVNGDGSVDSRDAMLMMQYFVGMITSFPIE